MFYFAAISEHVSVRPFMQRSPTSEICWYRRESERNCNKINIAGDILINMFSFSSATISKYFSDRSFMCFMIGNQSILKQNYKNSLSSLVYACFPSISSHFLEFSLLVFSSKPFYVQLLLQIDTYLRLLTSLSSPPPHLLPISSPPPPHHFLPTTSWPTCSVLTPLLWSCDFFSGHVFSFFFFSLVSFPFNLFSFLLTCFLSF